MELLTGFLLFLSFFVGVSHGKILFQDPNYEPFRNCLNRNGNFSSLIVGRSNSKAYQQLNFQWQRKPPFKTPMAFVLVRNSRDVQKLVRCGTELGIHLMPKGGGHSLEKYAFGDSATVVVDVRKLKILKINKVAMTATVGAGWLIGPLNYALWKTEKVYTALGICPTVGISGIATGGGYGIFSRTLGLTVDSTLEMKIVTASGAILRPNKRKHSDLFWALRGGVGSNFGIVTQFVFKVHPAPEHVFYGTLSYSVSQFVEVFDAWQKYAPSAPASISAMAEFENGTFDVHVSDPTGSGANFEVLVKKFPRNGIKTGMRMTYPDHLFLISKHFEYLTPATKFDSPPDLENLVRGSTLPLYQKRKSFYTNVEVGSLGLLAIKTFLEEMPDLVTLSFEAYGGVINSVAPGDTAYVHRGTLYHTYVQYRGQTPNATAEAFGRFWTTKYFELGKTLVHHTESYQNYVDGTLPNYLQRYYGSNLKKLMEVKRSYDPKNYFHFPQSIPT